jgi:thymidine phosphorylase
MQNRPDAEALASALTAVGNEMGVSTSHLLTPMDQPHGQSVGNALEVAECVEVLQGRGPRDIIELTLDLAERVATVPRAQLQTWLSDGTAWKKFVAMVEAQGGDSTALERIRDVHRAPIVQPMPAPHAGRVTRMDAGSIGRASVALGAGRAKATDAVDFAVGFSGLRKVGETVSKAEPLLTIHARTQATLDEATKLLGAGLVIEAQS